jgi:hypothetical protein
MTLLERAGLEIVRKAFGESFAQRLSFQYRDRVQPAIESLTYSLSPAGRRSRAKLQRLRDQYRGERCFIIGNGPSLNQMDLSPLRREFTFGLNRGYLLFDRIGGPTTFLVAVNRYVVEQFASDLISAPSHTFLSWRSRKWVPRGTDVTFIRRSRLFTFSADPGRHGAWEGATVTYVALQLAHHFGFSDVILIGVDHSFATGGPANELVTASASDPNHFDPTYFGPGVRWQLPDLEVSEAAYRLARERFEADGRRIRDASVGGRLTVFPRDDFDRLFDRF